MPSRLSLLLLCGLSAAPISSDLLAQSASPPADVARDFNRGFQSMAWSQLVLRVHPQGLAYLRVAVDILVRSDTSGYVLDTLLGGVPAASYEGLSVAEAVERILAGVQREVPGLLSSLVSRRTEVLGVVPEAQDRHVVYRVRALLQGAEPRIRVMTLSAVEGAWRVRDAEDLRVLHTAIRGIPIPGIPDH